MKRWFFRLCFVGLLPWAGHGAEDVPALALVDYDGFVRAKDAQGPQLQWAIWLDGRTIWRGKGERLLSRHLEAAKVRALLKRLDGLRIFDENSFRHEWLVPDGGSSVIWVQSGAQHTRLSLWREDGKEKSGEFQQLLKVWSEVKSAVAEVIPKDGKLYTGPTTLDLPR